MELQSKKESFWSTFKNAYLRQRNLKTFDISIAIDCLHEMEKRIVKEYMINFENVSKLLYFKVWEYAGLAYSFYQYYSVHEKKYYFIRDSWKEHLKESVYIHKNFLRWVMNFETGLH